MQLKTSITVIPATHHLHHVTPTDKNDRVKSTFLLFFNHYGDVTY